MGKKEVGTNLLSEEKANYIQQRRSVLELRKQEAEYERLKSAEKLSSRIKSGVVDTLNAQRQRAAFNPNRLQVTNPLTKPQQMLREVLGGGQDHIWGTGNNLPQINHSLNSGNGIIKSGDYERSTARMFGLR